MRRLTVMQGRTIGRSAIKRSNTSTRLYISHSRSKNRPKSHPV